jgi:hypothetical protein
MKEDKKEYEVKEILRVYIQKIECGSYKKVLVK